MRSGASGLPNAESTTGCGEMASTAGSPCKFPPFWRLCVSQHGRVWSFLEDMHHSQEARCLAAWRLGGLEVVLDGGMHAYFESRPRHHFLKSLADAAVANRSSLIPWHTRDGKGDGEAGRSGSPAVSASPASPATTTPW